MSLNFIIGDIGSGKSYAAAEKIKALAENNRSVTLIVPEQSSSETEHRLYNFLGIVLFNRIRIETFTRIKNSIFGKTGSEKRELPDDAAKAAVMFAAKKELIREELPFFRGKIGSASFTPAALKIVRELEMNGIEPEALISEKIGDNALAGKIRDIVRLCECYYEKLSESGYTNALSDGMKAADIAESTGFFKGQHIFIDGFKSFTADELRLIDSMGAQGDLTVCMPTPYRTPVSSPVFSTVNETLSGIDRSGIAEYTVIDSENDRFSAAPDIKIIGRNILRSEKLESFNAENISISRASDMSSETEYIASEISSLVRTGKYKYGDIAVLSRDFEGYKSLLETSLLRYEIPYFMDMTSSAGNEALIIFAMTLLEAADSESVGTAMFLRLIKTLYTETSESDISEAEEYFVSHGTKKISWDEISEPTETPDPDDIIGKLSRIKNEVLFPVLTFRKEVSGAHTLKSITDAFCVLLNSFSLAEKAVRGFSEESKEERDAFRLKKILGETLISVSSVHLPQGADLFTLREYRELFGIAVSQAKLSSPAHMINGVTAASADRARLDAPKVVFIMGANEGFFPYKVSGSGIFTERETEEIESVLGIHLNERLGRMTAEENFIAASAVLAPSEKLYISYSLSDIKGNVRYPSDLVGYIADKGKIKVKNLSETGAEEFITNENSARYQLVKNLGKDGALSGDKLGSAVKAYGELFGEFAEKAYSLSEKIRSKDIIKINISPENAEKIYLSGGKYLGVSPTSLEKYVKCPFMFFCEKGLRLRKTKPHAYLPNVRGNEIHDALSEILSHILKASEEKGISFHEYFSSLSDGDIRTLVSESLNRYYDAVYKNAGYESSPSFDKAFFREEDEITEIILHLKDEFSPENSKFTPSAFEYRIGKSNADDSDGMGPWRVDFSSVNGKKLTALLNGSVDRIDTFTDRSGESEETYIRVVDYKSGGKTFSFSDLADGLNMQMLIYLLAVTDEASFSSVYRGNTPAGIMYYPSRAAHESKNYTGMRKYPDTPESLAEIIKNNMVMNGFTVTDVNSIRAMEKETGGVFIPQKLNTAAVKAYIGALGDVYRNNTDEGGSISDIYKKSACAGNPDSFTYDVLSCCLSDCKNAGKNISEKYSLPEKDISPLIEKFLEGHDLSSANEAREKFMNAMTVYDEFDKKISDAKTRAVKDEMEQLFLSPDGKNECPSAKYSLDKKEFDNIRKYVLDKIKEVCRDISSGKADCRPLYYQTRPCDRCDYKALCENRGEISYRYTKQNAAEEMKNVRGKEKN